MVRNILTRPAIIGLYQPHVRANAKDDDGNEIWGKRISVVATDAKGHKIRPINYYPPVFDESDPDRGLYQKVMTSIRSRDKTGGRPKAKQFRNIVTRMVTCAVCGGRIYMHPTGIREGRKSHDYLHCVNYRFKTVLPAGHPLAGKCCTNKYGFDCALLEEMLLTLFEPEFATVLARLIPEADAHDDTAPQRLAAAVAKLAQIERAMKRFTALIATSSDDSMIELYDDEIKKLVAETAELKRERGRWEQEIKTSAVHIDENFAKRVRAAKAKIDAADDENRYEARADLHRVLRGRMKLELRPDRAVTAVIQAYPGAKDDMLAITFRRDCVLSATRFASNGST